MFGVRDVVDKLQECRLRQFWHLTRLPKNYVGCKCIIISVPGVRSLGRARKRWLDVMMQDMIANDLTTEEAKDRAKWNGLSSKADPGKNRYYCHEEKEEKEI